MAFRKKISHNHSEAGSLHCTGKSLLEALILASTNTQHDDKLFIELRDQYMKIASSENVVYTNCFLF